jgi:hypothetical protein
MSEQIRYRDFALTFAVDVPYGQGGAAIEALTRLAPALEHLAVTNWGGTRLEPREAGRVGGLLTLYVPEEADPAALFAEARAALEAAGFKVLGPA